MTETFNLYLKLVATIAEEKEKQGKELIVEGLENINPIYEALAGLLKVQLTDQQIVKRFALEENALRSVIVTDSLLDRIDSGKRRDITSLLESGRPVNDIIDLAATEIAQGKRVQEGNILYPASQAKNYENNIFMAALTYAKPNKVYIESNEFNKIKDKAKEISSSRIKKRVLKTVGGLLLALGIGSFAYYSYNHLDYSLTTKEKTVSLSITRR